MIENILLLPFCIYVQKYDYMNDNYFFCVIDRAFTLNLIQLLQHFINITCTFQTKTFDLIIAGHIMDIRGIHISNLLIMFFHNL